MYPIIPHRVPPCQYPNKKEVAFRPPLAKPTLIKLSGVPDRVQCGRRSERNASVNVIRTGGVKVPQVLQRRVAYILQLARQLWRTQNHAHIRLQRQVIAPLQIVNRPGVHAPVRPEIFPPHQQRRVARGHPIVQIFHIRDRHVQDRQRHKVDAARKLSCR